MNTKGKVATKQKKAAVEAATGKTARTTVLWKIEDLWPHPKQLEHFGPTNDDDPALRELAADIKENGLRDPPVVLPDGAIVVGHRRTRACKLLGWAEIPVLVDADLAKQGPEAVERLLIQDNLHRRQLDELAQARLYQRLLELEKGSPLDKLSPWELQDVRDRVAKRFGKKSGRTMSRLLQVLRTPVEVQEAFRAGKLPLLLACAVERLPKAQQQAVAQGLHAGGEPKVIVANYVAQAAKKKDPNRIFAAFVRTFGREAAALDDGVLGRLSRVTAGEIDALEAGNKLLQRLLTKARRVRAKQQRESEEALRELEVLAQGFHGPPDDGLGEGDALEDLDTAGEDEHGAC